MAGNKSDYLANQILDHVFQNGAYSNSTGVYLSLHTGSPVSTSNEVTDSNAYARQSVNFGAAAARATDNDAAVEFPEATGNWDTISHVAIYDTDTYRAGNQLFWGPVSAEKKIENGDVLRVPAGDLDVSYA